ncbi:MAG: hypothetical protein LAO20_14380 [Acidobacteriia bacterium]|nr:hypothetical protein [Terriglobia bacterium]
MSYIRTSTENDLGHRPLGWYQRARFPLPTTSLSQPINPRMGWDGAPYPRYAQPELSRTRGVSGEWVPPGPPPRATSQGQGAVTYRVDPATGKYRFYNTDILPRGVFEQTPQPPPAPVAITALRQPVTASGHQLVQLPDGRRIISRTSPGRRTRLRRHRHDDMNRRGMSNLNCGAPCSGLGADVCGPQPDGTIVPCPPDPSMATEQGDVSLPGVTPTVVAPAPGTQRTTFDFANPAVPPITATSPSGFPIVFSFNAGTPRPTVVPAQTSVSTLFSGSTRIGSAVIPNVALLGGGALLVMAMANKGKRR